LSGTEYGAPIIPTSDDSRNCEFDINTMLQHEGLILSAHSYGRKPVVIYIDPFSHGHHADYLAFFKIVCERTGQVLKAWVPEDVWNQANSRALGVGCSDVLVRPVDATNFSKWQMMRLLEKIIAYAESEEDAIIVLALLDPFLLGFALRKLMARKSKVPWQGILFRDSYNFPEDEAPVSLARLKSIVKFQALRLALRNGANALLTHNSLSSASLCVPTIWLPNSMSSLNHLAEQAVEQQGNWPVRQEPPKIDNRLRLFCFGVVTRRKGLVEFCRGLLMLENRDLERIEFKIMGEMPRTRNSPQGYVMTLRNVVQRLNDRGALVEFVGTYVSDRAIDEGLRWCDVVVAPYIGHVGSSGLINIAAQYGRPVIAQSSGQVGTEVRGHDLGVTIDARNSRDIVAAIQCFLAGTFQLGDKMDQYRRRRTYSRALDIATKALANTRTLCPAE